MLGPLLGGGYGYLQGFYGLVSGNLISARVVLASSEVISVSADGNSSMSESCFERVKSRLSHSSSYWTNEKSDEVL